MQTRKCTQDKDFCKDHSRVKDTRDDHSQLSHTGDMHSRVSREWNIASGRQWRGQTQGRVGASFLAYPVDVAKLIEIKVTCIHTYVALYMYASTTLPGFCSVV